MADQTLYYVVSTITTYCEQHTYDRASEASSKAVTYASSMATHRRYFCRNGVVKRAVCGTHVAKGDCFAT